MKHVERSKPENSYNVVIDQIEQATSEIGSARDNLNSALLRYGISVPSHDITFNNRGGTLYVTFWRFDVLYSGSHGLFDVHDTGAVYDLNGLVKPNRGTVTPM